MGFQSIALASAGIIGVLVTRLLIGWAIIHYKRTFKYSREHGCQLPPKHPQNERFIGYQIIGEGTKAAAEKRVLEMSMGRYDATGHTYTVAAMGTTIYLTRDPENIKTVLATNFKDFGLGQRIYAFGPLLGHGIFTSDGAHWERSRALIRPNFNKAHLANFESAEKHFQHLVAKVPTDGSTVDLQPLFFNMTLDSATEFLFGVSVESQLAAEGSESEKFSHAFDYAQFRVQHRNRVGRLASLVPDPKFKAACKTVHAFADRYVAKTLENRDQEKSPLVDIEKVGERERYIFLNEVAKETSDPKQLRDEMLNILLAGRDTTAGLLGNVFHCLARHPKVWEKLKAEVDRLDGKIPNYETLRDMKYLKYVLNETLRLYPGIPTNARVALKDTILPRGGGPTGAAPVFIPKDSLVVYSTYSMHRRRDIYGDNADEFVPERWASDAPNGPLRPGWGYLPFNGGPRICVGQQYALTEAGYTIVRLLQTYSSIENRDDEPWVEGYGLTLCSGNGAKVALKLR